MRTKPISGGLCGVVAVLGLASCGGTNRVVVVKLRHTPHAEAAVRSTASAASESNTTSLQRLSVDQLAGQMIIYSYAGPSPPALLLSKVRRGEAAGVIFFAPNAPTRTALRSVVRELDRANAASPIHAPLLLMTDQEGGQVRRLPGWPEYSEEQIGESSDALALAPAAGRGAAANLASAGLNVNLAPVLDVYREPGNFIDQYERSYGRNPARVGELGAASIAAQQRDGVAATAKHFPGLGAATRNQDTDERPVTLKLSLRAIRTTDEAPYHAAIAAHVRLVMLSWAVYPALDPTLPGGLSPTIIQGELRHRLGFAGVTITDSLEAGALSAFGGPAQRAILAARAGDDLILCSARHPEENTPAIGLEAQSGITSAIAAREIPRSEIEQAAAAVIALRTSI